MVIYCSAVVNEGKFFRAEWHTGAKRDECIWLWKVSLKGETILQMTQQISPKAPLNSALRRCHSTELKTHQGSWYYSVLLAPISALFFYFFWISHHFLLSPFLSHSPDPNKTPTFGNETHQLLRSQFGWRGGRDVPICTFWIPVVLSIKHVGTHTVCEKTQRSDASHRCSMLSFTFNQALYKVTIRKRLPFSITRPWLYPVGYWSKQTQYIIHI